MLDTVFGLPVHALVVHATVVVVPTAAVAVVLAALWPRFRRWAGWLPLVLSAVAVALVPLSTSSGEELEKRVGRSSLVEQHAHLADGLLPWVIGLLVVAVLLAFTTRRTRTPRGLALAGAVLAVVAGAGTAVQVVRIGHSGAQAAWSDVAAKPAPGGGG